MLRWRGVLLREGVETGEFTRRMIDVGATRWRSLPRDLGCVFEDGSWGHENARVVGTIEIIEVRGADVYGEGTVLLGNEDADEWASMNRQGALRGCSVDLTAGEVIVEVVSKETGEVVPDEIGFDVLWGPEADDFYVRERWTDAEIGSVAVCRVPAFSDALIEVYDTDDEAEAGTEGEDGAEGDAGEADAPTPAEVTASAYASIDEVEVGDDVTWTGEDGAVHEGVVSAVDTDAETVTVTETPDEGDPIEVVLPVADVQVADAGEDDAEGDDTEDAASSDYPELARRAQASAVVVRHEPRPALRAMLARERGEVVTAAAMAAAGPGAVLTAAVAWDDGPPAEFFSDLDLDEVTPLTITDDGEVFGHVALFGQCHTGFAAGAFSKCVMPARSPSNYALFHSNGQVRAADGSRHSVGILSMDTKHAPAGKPGRRPSASAVADHYEHTGLTAAWLRAHDGPIGVEVHGALRSGLDIDAVRRAMAAHPSGDWRDYGDGLDMLGLLQVNVPGYPVYEIEDGATTVLMASLVPPSLAATPPAQAAAGTCSGDCGCGGTCGGNGAHAHQPRAALRSARLRRAAIDAAFRTPVPTT